MICGRLSITNLWVAGSNSGESGVVIRTYDGGTTRVNTQAVKNGEVNAIHFSDDQKGWAIGSRVSRTNNGDLTDVHYTDAQNGSNTRFKGSIFKTTNGGQTWSTYRVCPRRDIMAAYFLHFRNGVVPGDPGPPPAPYRQWRTGCR